MSILCLALLTACTGGAAQERAHACDALAAEAADVANRYVRSAGGTLDPYDPFFSGPAPPPMPKALDALPQRFRQAGCSPTQAGDALRRHATDVRGDGIGAQAIRGAMLEGDLELRRLIQVIEEAQRPS